MRAISSPAPSVLRSGRRRGSLRALGLGLILALASGCFVVERRDSGREGYRRVEDEDFSYRRDVDLYVGVNLPSVYWCDGDFYRPHSQGYWEWSRHPRGPWYYVANEKIPPRLWKAYGKAPRSNKQENRRDRNDRNERNDRNDRNDHDD